MRKISTTEWVFAILMGIFGSGGFIAVASYGNGDVAGVLFVLAFVCFVYGQLVAIFGDQGGDRHSQESNRRTDVRPKETTERCQDR